MSVIIAIAAVGFVAWTICQQVIGTTLNSRRVVILPAILTIVGIVDVTAAKAHATPTDDAIIVAGAVLAVLIGLGLGTMTRLRAEKGYLWGQLPTSGLYLWAAFFASHIALMVLAHALGAHLAAGTDAVLLSVGLNRVAQAAVVVSRGMAAGIPFAPDKNGASFGAGWYPNARAASDSDAPAGIGAPDGVSARTDPGAPSRFSVSDGPRPAGAAEVSGPARALQTVALLGANALGDRRGARSRRHSRRF